ncbi:hypothetical protein [Methylocapsa palsarum]|uniref:Uncharacterized protein n=1 Tax=Methylocapsa palsarum TaxID=1612308 RepID=A0A1I4C6E4_9HYPH|nr:hypothetical protein [Methylocapsa palsarum]SFK75957.1 hypothetical protein SAMN05444581_11841 [Methylocapsa palsarum]
MLNIGQAMLNIGKALSLLAAGAICAAGAAAADLAESAPSNVYLFRVNCPMERYVAQWAPGSADRGQTYFRIATGNANLDCSIYDYNAATDAALPRRDCGDPGGIIQGFPGFLALLGATHCQ